MSGGVDSAVSALLLMEQGYDVVGVNLRTWDYEEAASCDPRKKSCCSPKDIQDARDTGLQLNIPFYVVRIEKDFREKVIDRFILDYTTGRTPNPCVECNTFVKFGILFEKARSLGIQKIATGHYARIHHADRWAIRGGKDLKKNQAYYLYGLSQEALANTVFPLGDMEKSEVREVARRHNLPVAEKEESQEICFVPENDYRKFLQRSGVEFQPGYFMDTSGRILGKHAGKEQFTIGQRKGLGIAWKSPLYVIRIEDNGNVILAEDLEEVSRTFTVEQTIFQALSPAFIETNELSCRVQVRYRSKPVKCTVKFLDHSERTAWNGQKEGTRLSVEIHEDAGAVTPGQSAVFFPESGGSLPDDVVLAGGVISK
jgi:tRNA-specific 2-thiouridylase